MLMQAGQALAQSISPDADASAPADGTIIVTAEKRSTRLVDTPISIVAVSGKQLQSAGVTNLLELSMVTPGLRMDTIGNNSQPTIRGISSDVNGAGLSANVATYIDGFYLPGQQDNDFDLPDVSAVEVLKGPQGTLFGRNATGGAIRVTTMAPSFDTSGKVSLSYGSFDDMRASAFVTGPLTDRVAGSVYVNAQQTDGWTRDIYTGKQAGKGYKINGRGKLLFNASDRLSFLLSGTYMHLNSPEYKAWHTEGINYTATPGAVIADQPFTTSEDLKPRNEVKYKQGTLTTTLDLDFAKLVSYTQIFDEDVLEHVDLDGTSAEVLNLATRSGNTTFTQEVNLVSPDSGFFTWVVGAYYFHDNSFLRYLTINGPNTARTRVITNSYSAFADGTINFLDNFYLTGGLRYTEEHKRRNFGVAQPYLYQSDSWNNLTPRGILRYKFQKNANVYVSYSQGFKAGGYNQQSPAEAFAPEKIKAFEGGFKYSDRALSLDLAAYHYKYSNLQVSSYNITASGAGFEIRNAAAAKIYGLEASATYRLTPELSAMASGAYAHGRYESFPGAADPFNNPIDATGKILKRTPKFTANAGINYSRSISYGTIDLSANGQYTSAVYYDALNLFRQGGYAIFNTTGKWTAPDGGLSAAITVKNLTDKYYARYFDPIGPTLLVIDAAPRTVLATISYNF
jgi:iron complex outermembrane receptor protein